MQWQLYTLNALVDYGVLGVSERKNSNSHSFVQNSPRKNGKYSLFNFTSSIPANSSIQDLVQKLYTTRSVSYVYGISLSSVRTSEADIEFRISISP